MTDQLADRHWRAEFPAEPARLSALRQRVDRWLAGLGVEQDDRYDLLMAVNEAVSNSIEHAYPPGSPGSVRVEATVEPDGRVRVVVADDGRWRVPPPGLSSRGRGLLLMRESVDEVLLDRSPGGTTVVLVLSGRHSPGTTRLAVGAHQEVVVRERAGWVEVVVRGDVPVRAGPAVRRAILTAARGGAVPVVVDLRELGDRADGLVRSLRAVASAAAEAGTRVVVRAPEGGSAHRALVASGVDQVVDLVGHASPGHRPAPRPPTGER
ncbi:ATP-binding protein [Actinosynnema pretiosum subsp. pretiosum]|uniref:ATP-binding protein n=2 Tax=Actinosynnema TaxID=40566 RepID=A0AA45R398_9PSEU|nr:ATP-binding protein [Actinosynnema mirum]ACU39180.1 putative anti-sigma regulatory factor, serine/threonine protein kinase [Actinosynnema mirum DSM 43827]AXX32779.1 Serine phosphatase RsbU, regulator of sigma subunit [Actinosynnema pretiosum subsp. pretiosum]QUF03345.1 ATP-binding protein [Actinosynnema pretiosum subsp. pretiosum]